MRPPTRAAVAFAIAVGLTVSSGGPGRVSARQATVLSAGAPIERALLPGQSHKYEIHLDAQHFLHVEAIPRGINFLVRVFRPNGQQWMSLDYGDEATPETILLITEMTGRYEIEVFGEKDVPAGSYTIRIEALRPATVQDATRVAARRKLEEGIRTLPTLPASGWEPLVGTFEAARAGFRDVGDGEGEATASYELAVITQGLRRPDARKWADEALARYRELGNSNGMGKAVFEIGKLHDRAGELPQALAAYSEAAELFRKAGNRTWQASALNGMGIAYARSGETERAVDRFVEAAAHARAMQATVVETSSLNNLGIATKTLGDYRSSRAYYEQGLAGARAARDRGQEANVLNNLGNLYRLLGEYDKALIVHNDALALARQLKDQDNEARALNTLGLTHSRLGDFRKALDFHEQSLAIRRQLKDPAALAASLDAAGRAWHRLKEPDKAVEHLSEALRLNRAIGDPSQESATLRSLALVERDRGKLPAALDHITASVDLTDSLRGRVISPDLRASFVASAQEQYELHTDILMQLHRERPSDGFDGRALEASERGRARVLLELLLEARTDIRQGVDPALLQQERTSQRQIDDASARISRLLSRQSDAKEIDAARAELQRATADARALRVRIRQESPAYAALTQPAPIAVADIQRDLIDADTILVEYALGETRSWLWLVTPTAVASFELPPRQQIERAARDLYGLLTARQPKHAETAAARRTRVVKADADLRRQAAALGRMLVGPVAAHLGSAWRGKRMLVVAPDALQYVPFAALIDPAVDGQPLVAGHEIVTLPSASVLAVIRRDDGGRATPGKAVAVMADPVFEVGDPRIAAAARGRDRAVPEQAAADATGRAMRSMEAMGAALPQRLSRLPFSRQEARAITAFVPREQRLEAIDFDASRAMALSGDLAGYRIVHFATHGFLNSEQPELSGLVLSLVDRDGRAQDGFLRLNDIYNLRLPADVVVLSACQTGLGAAIRGEGLVGLTRGFMYAGARRVVASLWQVDDLATAELMRLFYRGMLKDRLSPAAALRSAQRELARDPRWASPFYWSAFVLQGESK